MSFRVRLASLSGKLSLKIISFIISLADLGMREKAPPKAPTNFNNSFSAERDGNAAHDNTLALNHLEHPGLRGSSASSTIPIFYETILSMCHGTSYHVSSCNEEDRNLSFVSLTLVCGWSLLQPCGGGGWNDIR